MKRKKHFPGVILLSQVLSLNFLSLLNYILQHLSLDEIDMSLIN